MLVQSVTGIHSGVNPISGDFSTGAAGLLVSGGEVGAPVREFTIASTLQRMLLDVVEIGGDLERLPMSASGVSLVVADVALGYKGMWIIESCFRRMKTTGHNIFSPSTAIAPTAISTTAIIGRLQARDFFPVMRLFLHKAL